MSYDAKESVLAAICTMLKDNSIPCHQRLDSVSFSLVGTTFNGCIIYRISSVLIVDELGTAAKIELSSPTMMSDVLAYVKVLRCRLPVLHIGVLDDITLPYYLEI